MKKLLPCLLLLAGAGLMPASILETINFNLSALNPGSTLSGTFALSNSPMAGDTAPVVLTFSDPSDYSPTSIMATIQIGSGTTLMYTVGFSVPNFTNLTGTLTPLNTRSVNLTTAGMAQCASFPCTATGRFQDNTPALFTSMYTIAPASVPEPSYGLLLPVLFAGFFVRRRIFRTA